MVYDSKDQTTSITPAGGSAVSLIYADATPRTSGLIGTGLEAWIGPGDAAAR
jgi:hypothetical protein